MAVDKRKNVAAFPVTLWTDRWDSSSQFHTLLFLTWMLWGGGVDELPKRIWRDVKDNTLNIIWCIKGTTSHPQKNKFLKVIPAFLNLLHMGSPHFAVILWSEFFSHRLAWITLQSSITHQHCQALARQLFEPDTVRKLAQELWCSEDSIFSSDFGKLVSVNSTSAAGRWQQVFPGTSLLSGQWP